MTDIKKLEKEKQKFLKKRKNKIRRNTWTGNDIIKYENYAEIFIRDKKQNLVGITKIDLKDLDWVKGFKWHLIRGGKYVGAYIKENDDMYQFANKKELVLHRGVIRAKEGQIVDHINNDKFDNRRKNLRIVKPKQNALNRRKEKAKIIEK